MPVATTIADEILDLKRQRKAILLAHHYQEPEIQELADVVGDSLELARKARDFAGDVIAFSPPLVITEAEIDALLDRSAQALDDTLKWTRSWR